MLGETYALALDADEAAELWQTAGTAKGQMDLRRWWHDGVGTDQEVQWFAEALAQSKWPSPTAEQKPSSD